MTTTRTSDNDPTSIRAGFAIIFPLIAVVIVLGIVAIVKSNSNPAGCSIGQTHDYVVQAGDTLYGPGGIFDREIEGSQRQSDQIMFEMLKDLPENEDVIGIGRDGSLQVGSVIELFDSCTG